MSTNGTAITLERVSLWHWSTWLPTYGLFGGPNWSAGYRGDVSIETMQNTAPVNALDALFQAHDIAYAEAEQSGVTNWATLKLQADVTLLQGLARLDYSTIPTAQQTAAEDYAVLAGVAFAEKLLTYDIASVAESTIQNYVTAIFTATGATQNNGTGMTLPGQTPVSGASYTSLNNGDGSFYLLYENGAAFYSSNMRQQWTVPDSTGNGGATIYSRDTNAGTSFGDWTVQQVNSSGVITSTTTLSGTIPGESLTLAKGSGSNPFITGTGDATAPPSGLTAAEAMAMYEATGMPISFSNQTAAVANGNAQTFTIYASSASSTSQTVTLTLAGGSGTYDISTGANLIPLSGTVSLVIPAGQDSATFTLIDTSNSGTAGVATLTASMTDASGTVMSNNLTVNFANPADVRPANVIAGTASTATINGVQVPITVYSGDGANDLISTGGGLNSVNGGNGSNIIVGNGGQDILISGNGDNQIYANAQTDLASALSQQKTATASGQKGVLIAVGDGNNTIVGGNGNDAIFTGAGNNTIVCGPGSVAVVGGVEVSSATLDWSISQVSWDTSEYLGVNGVSAPFNAPTPNNSGTWNGVPRGLGNDTIFGGTGNSTYSLSNGNNWLDAGGGNDFIGAGLGNNTIFGGIGNDTILGHGGSNYINLESGNDYVVAQGGNQIIIGDTGNDTIFSGDAGSGWASSETSANNYIIGGAGNSVIYGSGGNDTLIGGTGNSTINGGNGNEYIFTGDGNVSVNGGNGNETIDAGGNGNDTIWAGSGSTTIYGGNGSDVIVGGAGTDVISAGDGGTTTAATYVYAGSGTSTISGGAGVDWLLGGSGTDTLIAGTGISTLKGGSGTEVMYSSIGNDTLIAGTGSDTLYGGGGTDVLQGTSGNTLYVAGSGNETIVGGSGSNTYLFNAGFGNIELQNAHSSDTFQFGTGISVGDLSLSTTSSNALLIQYGGGQITLDGGLNSAVSTFTFADGSVLTLPQLMAQNANPMIIGSSANSTLIGGVGDTTFVVNNTANVVQAQSTGNNTVLTSVDYVAPVNVQNLTGIGSAALTLTGNDLNNVITANIGNDTLVAGTSIGTLVGGTGNNTFVVNNIGDVVQAQSTGNNTVLTSVDYVVPDNVQNITGTGNANITLTGNTLNDTITANSGNDTLVGGTGLDTFVMQYNMGANTIIDSSSQGGIIQLSGPLSISDLSAMRQGNDLLLQINGTQESTLIQGYYTNPQTTWTIKDASGNSTTPQGLQSAAAQSAAMQMESAFISQTKLTELNSLLSSGYLAQSNGSYTFSNPSSYVGTAYYAYQNSYIYNDSNGVPSISYNYTLSVPANFSVQGSNTTSFNSVTTTTDASVVNADNAVSASYSSTVGYSHVSWQTVGSYYGYYYAPSWSGYSVQSGSGVVSMLNGGVYGWEGTTGTAVMYGYLSSTGSSEIGGLPTYVPVTYDNQQSTFEIQTINLGASNHTVNANQNTVVNSSSGNDTIYGAGFAYGGSGNDLLINGNEMVGGSGNDTLVGQNFYGTEVAGSGYDFMQGDAATYYVPLTSQSVDVIDNSSLYGGSGLLDTLVLPAGVHPSDLNWRVFQSPAYPNSNVMQISYGEANVFVVYSKPSTWPPVGINEFQFSDGTVLTLDQLMAQATPYSGTAALTSYNADGSYSSYTQDALGNAITVNYDSSGNKLSDSWVHADGTFSKDIFNADGSSSGTNHNLDGSSSHYTNDGHGDTTTTNYDVYGNDLGYSIAVDNGLGTVTTKNYDPYNNFLGSSVLVSDGLGDTTTTNYDSNGNKLGDSWNKTNGSYGNDTFNSDGSSNGTSYNPDGSYSSYTSDSLGNTTTTNFDVNGIELGYSTAVYTEEGRVTLFTTTNYDANGMLLSSIVVYNDNMGDITTTNYSANGNKLSDSWVGADGSYGTDTFNSDGSSSDTYYYPDGSHGSDIYNADGSSSGAYYNSDGSYYTYTQNTSSNYSNYSEQDYAANGSLTGSITSIWVSDGSGNSTEITYDGSGNKISDGWSKSNGSYGYDTFNADGSSNGTTYNADGSYSSYTNDGVGDTTTTNYDANGNELGYNTVVNNGYGTVSTTNYDVSGNVLKSTVVTNDGQGDITTTNSEPNGSYQKTWVTAAGNSGSNDYNAVTGEMINATTTVGAGYSTTSAYLQNIGGVYGYTEAKTSSVYANGSSFASDYLQNIGGIYGYTDTSTSSVNADGSTSSSDYVQNIGGVYGYTESKAAYTYADHSTYNTDYVSYADGSYFSSWNRSDGTAASFTSNADGTWNDSWVHADGSQGIDAGNNHLLYGAAAIDSLTAPYGNSLLIGGAGNDTIVTDYATNIIAFNKGDGQDALYAGSGQNNTLSLGGNFAYSDLALQKSGTDLILDVGTADSITFKGWYAGNSNIVNLQVVASAMSDFAPGSTNVLSNSNVEEFNFQTLVSEFDQAQLANPSTNPWAVTNALLSAHLSGSNTAALGGDLAYVYGTQGNLSGFGVAAAANELSSAQFGSAAQTLNPWPTLNTGTAQIR